MSIVTLTNALFTDLKILEVDVIKLNLSIQIHFRF